MASPASQTVAVNDTFTVTTNYSTLPAMPTTGVSLRLHYNANLVSFDVGDITVPRVRFRRLRAARSLVTIQPRMATTIRPRQCSSKWTSLISMAPSRPSCRLCLMRCSRRPRSGTANFNYSFRNATGTTSSTPATVTINAAVPTVGVAVSPSSVLEDGTDALTYTFTRSGDDSKPLSVSYTVRRHGDRRNRLPDTVPEP